MAATAGPVSPTRSAASARAATPHSSAARSGPTPLRRRRIKVVENPLRPRGRRGSQASVIATRSISIKKSEWDRRVTPIMGAGRRMLAGLRPLGALSLSPRFAGLRQRRAVIVTHPHISFAPAFVGGALRPGLRPLHRRARQPGTLQKVQRTTDDPVLHVDVPGFAAGITEGKIHEQEARHAALLD